MRMFSRMGISQGNGARIGAETTAPGGTLINPVIVKEKTGSREVEMTPTGARMTRLFNIIGLDDTIEAQTFGPPVGDVFPGGLVAVRRLTEVDTDQKKGAPILTLTVTYERERGQGVTFQDRDDFRLSGESVNIKQVKTDDDAAHFPEGSAASEDGRMIGYNKNTLEAEGVSVLDPILSYTATRHLNSLSTAQITAITNLQGMVNKGDFFEFKDGEVLFLGANIQDLRNQGVWRVVYEFQIRKNRTNGGSLKINLLGDDGNDAEPTTVPKEGWQFLTFNLADKGDKSAPQYAHVWDVYEKEAFTTLPGLGTVTPWANRSTFPPILSST